MLGLQASLGIKLNFFNFIALPVTFGIGVDYGVNLLQRYRFEGRGSMRRVLGTVGGAILLCSLNHHHRLRNLTHRDQSSTGFFWLASSDGRVWLPLCRNRGDAGRSPLF